MRQIEIIESPPRAAAHKGYEAQLWGSEKHNEARAPRRAPIPDNVVY